MAVYKPKDDPFGGVREALMYLSLGLEKKNKKQDQLSQMQNLLGSLQPDNQGYIDMTGLSENVTDPGMVQSILPYVLQNNAGMTKAKIGAGAKGSELTKMTIRKGNQIKEIMVPKNQWNDYAEQIEAKGWSVSDSALPKDETTPTPKEAAKAISGIDRAIYRIKTLGAIDDPAMAIIAASNPELAGMINKESPDEAIKTLESERNYWLEYAPDVMKKRYQTTTGDSGKVLDEETAIKLLKEAGGDKEKARKMAKEQGYTF